MSTVQDIFSWVYLILYYLLLPIVIVLRWLLIALGVITAPLLHLGHYVLHACLWPLRFLAKFEVCALLFTVLKLSQLTLLSDPVHLFRRSNSRWRRHRFNTTPIVLFRFYHAQPQCRRQWSRTYDSILPSKAARKKEAKCKDNDASGGCFLKDRWIFEGSIWRLAEKGDRTGQERTDVNDYIRRK